MLFALVGMVLLFCLVIGGTRYKKQIDALRAKRDMLEAEARISLASISLASALAPDSEWLDQNEPAPQEYSKAMTDLQTFVAGSSNDLGFSTFGLKLFNIEPEGGHYRRTQVVVSGKGNTEQIIQWLCKLHSPKAFRGVSSLKISPDPEAKSLVTCQVTVDQWIVESHPEFTGE